MPDAGPLGPLFKHLLGRPASCAYRIGLDRRNARFDRGQGVTRFDQPVISVGNLSVGGTGKTPMVESIIRLVQSKGHSPCIAMRGYRSRDGASDEADAYRAAFPDLPIVARPDRASGLSELMASSAGTDIDTIVLDDGFQHRQIARDLDLVLIDATRSPFDDHLLPMGWLREMPSALSRADHVAITRADQTSPESLARLHELVEKHHGSTPIATCRHAWNQLHSNEGSNTQPVASLQGQPVLLACAIGNPEALLAQCEQNNIEVVEHIFLRDHDPYAPRSIDRISAAAKFAKATAILTTQKDWTKLSRVPADTWPVPVFRPDLGIRFIDGESAFQAAIQRVCCNSEK